MTTELANSLEKQYNDLNFRNHCYLRIAYDNTVGTKWDTVIDKPFTKNASAFQKHIANELLILYSKDKELLMHDNKKSLTYRNKL